MSVNRAVDMGMDGGGQSGIHSGWVKVLGVAEYTSEKCSSACHCLKEGWNDAQQSSSGEAIIRWCAYVHVNGFNLR